MRDCTAGRRGPERGSLIRVVIVDDSLVARVLLQHVLEQDPEIRVVGLASNGRIAVDEIKRLSPDVVTMDLEMPVQDGFETIRRLMEEHPVPIVVVSGTWPAADTHQAFRATEAGAVGFVEKPPAPGHPEHMRLADQVRRIVRAMSEIHVLRRRPRVMPGSPARPGVAVVPTGPSPSAGPPLVSLVAIGASTGGPPALRALLERIPQGFSCPIVVVQHMTPGFMDGMVDWLRDATGLPIEMVRPGLQPLSGHVYFASDGYHLVVQAAGQLTLTSDPPEHGMRPAVSALFRSVARIHGRRAIGVLLTGMGRDGAAELKLMRDAGAVTFAQDERTSAVFGMPGEAVRLDAASHVLPPEGIADSILNIVENRGREGSWTSR